MEAGEEGNKTRLAGRNEMLSNETKFAFEFSEIPSARERGGAALLQSKASPVSFVQLMENVNKIPRQNILQLQRTRLFDYTTRTALPPAPPLPLPLLLLLLLLSWYIKSTRLHWSLNIKRQLGSLGRGEGKGEANLQHGCSRAKVLPTSAHAHFNAHALLLHLLLLLLNIVTVGLSGLVSLLRRDS